MNVTGLPQLYKKAKTGKIQTWRVWAEENKVMSMHGQLDGAQTEGVKKVTGKNIGRKNEVSPEDQAVFVAESTWKKKKDKGYFESIEEAENTQVFLPMLASDFEKRKAKVKYPVFVQPKLDGVRCLASWEGDRVKLMSRGGKEYNIPHISKELEAILHPSEVFDGEIYVHGYTFQEVTRLVKKYREGETEELQFWIYDRFSTDSLDSTFEKRLLELAAIQESIDENSNEHERYLPSLKVTRTMIVNCEKSIYKSQQQFVKEGFEGAIVRENHGTYELGHRSQHLLKVKSFMDEEYKVIGFGKAEGTQEGAVVWRCKTGNDQEFNVKPKGTLKENRKLYDNGSKYIGSMLKVKFFEFTDEGIPRFPVGIGIRLPEDM